MGEVYDLRINPLAAAFLYGNAGTSLAGSGCGGLGFGFRFLDGLEDVVGVGVALGAAADAACGELGDLLLDAGEAGAGGFSGRCPGRGPAWTARAP